MELSSWLSLATICILGAMSPGPSLAVVMRHTIGGGTINGMAAAMSHGLFVAIYAALSIVGLSALLKQFPLVYTILVYGGAIYLLYMGIKILINRGQSSALAIGNGKSTSLLEAARDGAAIALFNPKLAVFFTALFSQFINDQTLNSAAGWIMVATVGIIDTLWYIIVALLIGYANSKLSIEQYGKQINTISGLVFIGLAARVVTL